MLPRCHGAYYGGFAYHATLRCLRRLTIRCHMPIFSRHDVVLCYADMLLMMPSLLLLTRHTPLRQLLLAV